MSYPECGETLAQSAQRGGRSCISGTIPGQVDQGPEEPIIVEDVPTGLDDLYRSLPT